MEISINTDLFLDTSEALFGKNIFTEIEEAISLQKTDILAKLKTYNKILNKLGLNIPLSKIKKIDIIDTTDFVGGIKPIGQNEYLLVISKYVLSNSKAKYFENMCYHELCHLYQFNKLFNEGLIYWNYKRNKLMAAIEDQGLINNHLKENKGHTIYWQEAADKINNNLDLELPVCIELAKDELVNLFLENFFKKVNTTDFVVDIDLIK